MAYDFPYGMRPASLAERKKFYLREFNEAEARKAIGRHKFIMLDTGVHSGLFLKRFGKEKIVLKDFPNLKKTLLKYLPEDVYYDRGLYKDKEVCWTCYKNFHGCFKCPFDNFLGQQLAFDLDPENVDCPFCGSLEDKLKRHTMYSFCPFCFNEVRLDTIRVYEKLGGKGFKRMKIFYSGRGLHIVVDDEETAGMSVRERKELVKELDDYLIDEWVTAGSMRMLRLPYSLHGLVTRVAKPVSKKELEAEDLLFSPAFIPKFIKLKSK